MDQVITVEGKRLNVPFKQAIYELLNVGDLVTIGLDDCKTAVRGLAVRWSFATGLLTVQTALQVKVIHLDNVTQFDITNSISATTQP